MIALRKKSAYFIGLVLCAVLVVQFPNAFAVTSRTQATNPTMDKLKGDIEYVSKQEAAEVGKYLALKAASQKAAANLASIDGKIHDAEARQKSSQDEAADARAEFAAAQERYDQAVKESTTAHERRAKAIVRLYQESSNPDAVPSVLSADPEDRQDVVRKTMLMQNYNSKQTSVISDADVKADSAVKEKLAHDDARIRAEAAEKTAADEEASLVPLRAQYATEQKAAKANEVAEQAIVNSIKSKKADYTKQMAQLQAESNALAAQIKKQQAGSSVPVAPGKMKRPVSASINSPSDTVRTPFMATNAFTPVLTSVLVTERLLAPQKMEKLFTQVR